MPRDDALELLVGRLEAAVEKRQKDVFTRIVSVIQLVALLGAIAGAFMVLGQKEQTLTNLVEHQAKQDNSLSSLREITADLAQTASSNSTTLAERASRLNMIEQRLRDLEVERRRPTD